MKTLRRGQIVSMVGYINGYVPERPLPKMAVETAANKKEL